MRGIFVALLVSLLLIFGCAQNPQGNQAPPSSKTSEPQSPLPQLNEPFGVNTAKAAASEGEKTTSDAYWRMAKPVSIIGHRQSSGGMLEAGISNGAFDSITIRRVAISDSEGNQSGASDFSLVLSPGGGAKVEIPMSPNCTPGAGYSLTVKFIYDSTSLQNAEQLGQYPIIGTCN